LFDQLLAQAAGGLELLVFRAADVEVRPGVAGGAGEGLGELVRRDGFAFVDDLVAFDAGVVARSV